MKFTALGGKDVGEELEMFRLQRAFQTSKVYSKLSVLHLSVCLRSRWEWKE